MHLPPAILGQHIVNQLQARTSAPVLMIGTDTFTRPQLGKLGCFNFLAAARVTNLLLELKVKNTRDLFYNVAPAALAIPGLGAIALATIGAAFEAKGIGTLADYIARHQETGFDIVTFTTMKHHVRDAEAARNEKRELKKRRERRRDTAHEIRVTRHVERSTTTH